MTFKFGRIQIIVWALALAFLVNLRIPLGMILNGTFSQVSFSDNDEIYNIPLSERISKQSLSSFLASALDPMSAENPELVFSQPYQGIFYFLGSLNRGLGISPILFSFFLDLVCTFLALICFYYLYLSLFQDGTGALLAAMVAVSIPWLASVQNLQLSPSFSIAGFHWTPIERDAYSCFPSQRFGPTQIGFFWFAWTLKTLIENTYFKAGLSRRSLWWMSIMVGLSIYIYIYPFLSLLIFGNLLLLGRLFSVGQSLSQRFLELLKFTGIVSLVSLPGLLVIFISSRVESITGYPIDEIRRTVPYSFEHLTVIVLLMLILKFQNLASILRRILEVGLVGVVTLLLLQIIQPITGILVAPYHFSLFYIAPFLSGLTVLGVYYKLSSYRLRASLAAVLFFAVIFIYPYSQLSFVRSEDKARVELYHYFSKFGREDVIIVQPFLYPFSDFALSMDNVDISPYVISAIYSIQVLPSNPMLFGVSSLSWGQLIREELLTGWIFSGEKRLAGACFPTSKILHLDLGSGVRSWSRYTRRFYCDEADSEFPLIDVCLLLRESKVTHLLYDANTSSRITERIWENFGQKIWTSSTGQYELYRFDREKLVEKAGCRQL